MTDIIRFPKNKDKLINDIKTAYQQHAYESVYALFEQYEASFELVPELIKIKCDTLYQLGAFLELREETIVLMKQGYQQYDTLMIYYVESLSGLKQYHQAVEVINQVIDEVQAHATRMRLLPIKDFAMSQIASLNEEAAERLKYFTQLSVREQIQTLLRLLDSGTYDYAATIASLLMHEPFKSNVQSLMLEYLRFASYDNRVTVQKLDQTIEVVPAALPGVDDTPLHQIVMPQVVTHMENHMPTMVDAVHKMMHHHAILLYPLDIFKMYPEHIWVKGYIRYFKMMLSGLYAVDEHDVINVIQKLEDDK